VTYNYDNENQLTSADFTSAALPDFNQTYDDNGNRTSAGFSSSTDNRLTTDGTFTYTYAKEGNRKTRTDGLGNITTYDWEVRGRLIAVSDYSGTPSLLTLLWEIKWVRKSNGSNLNAAWLTANAPLVVGFLFCKHNL